MFNVIKTNRGTRVREILPMTDGLLAQISAGNGAEPSEVVEWLEAGKTVCTNFSDYKLAKPEQSITAMNNFLKRRSNIMLLAGKICDYAKDDMLGAMPERINEVDMCMLGDIERKLQDAHDQLFRTGEYADKEG